MTFIPNPLQSKQKIMNTSKKKSDLANILDELRSEDPKKRITAVQDIKEVAAALGPARVRSELIGFLAQFIDDQQPIVLQLLNQLEGFANLLGGSQNEKALIPLLISFCKTDEKKVAFKACQLLQRIVQNSKELSLQAIKKLMKSDMKVSKECGVQLMVALLPQLQSSEPTILELYSPLFQSDNPQYKIIGSKYLASMLKNLKGKEQISKFFEIVFGEAGQLQKIYALDALVDFYEINNNFTLTKFKHLSIINSWRINMKICEIAPKIAQKILKAHFKLIFQPMFLKFMISNEPELRAASCKTLAAVTKHLNEEEVKSKLQPILKKLAGDPIQYVKIELSNNIVQLCGVVSPDLMSQCILPIILYFIKDNNSQIALGIIKNFTFLSTKLSGEVLEEKIIKPLLQQLATQNWRIKCQIIDILKIFLTTKAYLSDTVLKVFIGLTDDRIDAVRLKANQLLIQILSKNSKQWCDQNVIPKIFSQKQNASYIKKQNLLQIIEKTAPNASDKVLKEIYHPVIVSYLGDKVPNVRIKSLSVLKNTNKLMTSTVQKQVQKLKEDKDYEISSLAKKLRA